jgi:hypothetical protein
MRFYEIDGALRGAVESGGEAVRLRIAYDGGGGAFETVSEGDVVEASFTALKEAAGGVSARGEVLLDDRQGRYCAEQDGLGAGREVRVAFSVGEGLPFFERFAFFVDGRGFQDCRGPGRARFVRLGLRDGSALLRKTDESRDWTAPAAFAYSVVCDKTRPERSLVHLIAKRAGLAPADIDCATIPLSVPYTRLRKNVWAELSELARACRCHLECAPEKPLVFAHSPYQAEPVRDDDVSYCFSGEDVFYLRKTSLAGYYRNTVRLKFNLPVSLERQEIWRYGDPPAVYDNDYLIPRYPFRHATLRDVEKDGYEARYSVVDGAGQRRAVVYADEIDTKEEAEGRLDFEAGGFSYALYDAAKHRDKALVRLAHERDGDLYGASIHGRPIVLDVNRSCYVRDSGEMEKRGTVALNVAGSYFSADLVEGRPQYEDWAVRELAERRGRRRELTVKTHRAVFHARVGAVVEVRTKEEAVRGAINALAFRYGRGRAFQALFKIAENV